MARRKPRPTVREENERALLQAAEWVFAEQGFAGATTAAIAQRAGLPKANLREWHLPRRRLESHRSAMRPGLIGGTIPCL